MKKLSALPSWLFTTVTLIAILWLTLAPKPLGDQPPPLFPGADKLAHAIMFGGLVWMIFLDIQRKHLWRPIKLNNAIIIAITVSILGILIEIAQATMGLGRGFEILDIISDAVGAFLFAFIWLILQKYWSLIPRD